MPHNSSLPQPRTATLLALFTAFGLVSSTATAAEESSEVYQEQAKLIKAPEAVLKLGTDLFGDQINVYNGSVSFKHTDVALRGNNSLQVAIGRSLTVGSIMPTGRPFGRWALDIPHLKGTYSRKDGWINSAGDTQRCSNFGAPRYTTDNRITWDQKYFWSGAFLSMPGAEDQRLLKRASAFTRAPGPAAEYPVVTSNLWTFKCLPTLANSHLGAAGEGFMAFSPDGTRYRFDWHVVQRAPLISRKNQDVRPVPAMYYLQRDEVLLLPTLVTDRHGNTVTYTYDPERPNNLKEIKASDGRTLSLTYSDNGTGNLIKSVSDGTRTWNYSYVDSFGMDLETVELPDSSKWKLGGLRDLQKNVKGFDFNSCDSPMDATSIILTGAITHPSGARATYTLAPIGHGRDDVPMDCTYDRFAPAGIFFTNTLTSKTISGVGLTDMTWTYAYNSGWSVRPCGDNCGIGKIVLVGDPDGHTTRYTYGNRFEKDEGKLQKVESGWKGGSALRTVTTRYRAAGAAGYVAEFGYADPYMGDAGTTVQNLPVDQTVTTQQGVEFTSTIDEFDEFVRPKAVTKSSSLGTKGELRTYEDNFSKWILGQLKTVQVVTATSAEGKPVGKHPSVENSYDPTTANLKQVKQFGFVQKKLSYNSDGTLLTSTDGKEQITTFTDYKSGIPQKVVYADASNESALVSSIGTIKSITDETGATTKFGYDTIGRLTQIEYPAADTETWNKTIITYSKSMVPEHGLPGGHWRMDVATGNALRKVYFDALWRPVSTETLDVDDSTTKSVVRISYDSDSNTTFQSYPQSTYSAALDGIHTEFDALSRPVQTKANSELGVLVSTVEYASGLVKKDTNARGNVTESYFRAYDDPSNATLIGIVAPEEVTLTIARDLLGKTTAITRSGGGKTAKRSYVYDDFERLCKTIEPETGATLQGYDAANNVAWRAAGMDLPKSECDYGSVPTPSKMVFAHDGRNRLATTTFGDGSPAISRTYWPDGLPKTVASSGSVWSTFYNNRRLQTKESLAYANRTYDITRDYDANGSLSKLVYPDNSLSLDYKPNALGQSTKVGAFASEIKYHPNGAIATFNYGNGVAHSMTQNLRGLPAQTSDAGVMSDHYTYDENGNVSGIADLIQGPTSRTMAYDKLDRLSKTDAPGMWGTAGYEYDSLDNLTKMSVGAGPTARVTVHTFATETNRLTNISSSTAGYNFNYEYDHQGNIIKRGAQVYAFDQGNRMKAAVGKATYAYDGLGHRFSIVGADGINKLQLYTQGGQLLQTGPIGGAHEKFVYLEKHSLAQVKQDGSITYSHTDALGSPVARTNASGALTCRTHYEPYGLIAGGTPQQIGFTGHVNDLDTGLTYMQQRYYDPSAGRFLSIDPVTTDANTGGSFNRYAYANNSPYRYIDPDGRDPEDIRFGASVGLMGLSPEQEKIFLAGEAAAGPWAGKSIEGYSVGKSIRDVFSRAKTGPKPAGTGPHNKKIEEVAAEIIAAGGTILAGGGKEKEKLIPTPGGAKDGRRPDIIYSDANGKEGGVNVGKVKADGKTPIKREGKALNDLNGPGKLPTTFRKYN